MIAASDAVSIRTIARRGAEVGEGPVWLPERGDVAWIDMPAGAIYLTALNTAETRCVSTGLFLGAVAPSRDGWVAATGDGFASIDESGAVLRRVAVLDAAHRMNDAKCDPTGRFWSGSTANEFARGEGRLHVLEADWGVRDILDDLVLPNGLDWSPSGNTFYLADSIDHVVYAFECDLEAGSLGRRREIVRFSDADGMPDGLCVDAAGCLWLALWGGNRIVRISPDGDRLSEVTLPAIQTSSCTFGGDDLDVLIVTSAVVGLDQASSDDGAVFAVTGIDATGRPGSRFVG